LPTYDYAQAGYYFVTIATHNRAHLFGKIIENEMVLNVAGEMVQKWHNKLEDKFPNIQNHEMVIMPNHIHFVIEIIHPVGADPRVRPSFDAHIHSPHASRPQKHPSPTQGQTHGSAPTQAAVTVGGIVQWFKTMTTNTYIQMVRSGTLPPFDRRIWQRNFYEHVIRNDTDHTRIAEYITNNPLTWQEDIFATS
jgi:REP element-mobilizing transposase RayT